MRQFNNILYWVKNLYSKLLGLILHANNIILFVFLSLLLSISSAKSQEVDEAAIDASNQVKSRYINTFIKFIDWSNIPSVVQSHEILVCMNGDHKLAEKFANIPNNSSAKTSIKLLENPQDNELSKCNVIFIGRGAEERIPFIIAKINNLTIFTISEAKHFTDNGGILEMANNDDVGLFDKDKLNLRININKVEAINLKIDARLLQIATKERK